MPTSHYQQINEIIQLIVLTNPVKLLDLGVGFGTYGYLSREYLELWEGTGKYALWEKRIDGIEAFQEYLTPVHKFIYNTIYIGDALDVLPTLEEYYDLILLIDVLEHFDYEDGMTLLREARKHGRNILLSTPKKIGFQDEVFDNPYETHRFQWKRSHFREFTDSFFLANEVSLILYMGPSARDILARLKRGALKRKAIRMLERMHLKEPIRRLLGK